MIVEAVMALIGAIFLYAGLTEIRNDIREGYEIDPINLLLCLAGLSLIVPVMALRI